MTLLDEPGKMLRYAQPLRCTGRIQEVRGMAARVVDLPAAVGSQVLMGPGLSGEVVGFDREATIVMPLGTTAGLRPGDRVTTGHRVPMIRVGPGLLGRVMNALGEPIDGKGPLREARPVPMAVDPIDPMSRPLIDQPLATGVRAIDALLSLGRGQRIGVFAAPGLGKSTLLAMIARQTAADVSVIALVGERGRELTEFVERQLGETGLARSVIVCATGDEPPVMRVRAAHAATSIAEHFRDEGRTVLLIMDSVTRYCHAQRQIGLAAGEPPATKGYPPSVFARLAELLERCGPTRTGSITGIFSVLVEGDAEMAGFDPIAEAARGILDGHVALSPRLAQRGQYPAIDPLLSISRVADDVTDDAHRAARRLIIKLLADYRQVEELLPIGAYQAGSSPDFDLAIACLPAVQRLLEQGREDKDTLADFDRTRKQLLALVAHIEAARRQLQGHANPKPPAGPR